MSNTIDADSGRVAAFERRFELAVLEDLATRAGHGQAWNTLVSAAAAQDRQLSLALVKKTGWHAVTRQFQRSLLQRALTESGGNVTEAAARLGIARSHVYNIIADG